MPISLPNMSRRFLEEVMLGRVPGYSFRHKFGRNSAIGTTAVPVCVSGFYRTPTTAVSLELISTDAGDNPTGLGARKIRYNGIDANWARVNGEVATNGITASPFPSTLLRVDSWEVVESGVYADVNTPTPSQIGSLTIQETGGGAVWSTIDTLAVGYGLGRSQIGCVSISEGKTGYVIIRSMSIESGKPVSMWRFVREGADVVSAPFTANATRETEEGIVSGGALPPINSGEPITGPADVFFLARVPTTTASASIRYDVLLVDSNLL